MSKNGDTLDFTNLNSTEKKELYRLENVLKDEFLNGIDSYAKSFKKREYMWFMPLFSHGTAIDDTYVDLCRLRMALTAIKERSIKTIIVSSSGLRKAILTNVNRTGAAPKVYISRSLKEWAKESLSAMVTLRSMCSIIGSVTEMKRGIKQAGGIRLERFNLKSKHIVINEYFIGSQIADEKFYDRYFTGLKDNTEKELLFWIAAVSNKNEKRREIAGKIVKQANLIPYENFVCSWDYLNIISYVFSCYTAKARGVQVAGLDISSIIKRSMRSGASNTNSIMGILRMVSFKRFILKYNCVEKIIDWYEGQPSSLGLYHGIRQIRDDIPIYAYIGFPIDKMQFQLFPTKFQISSHVAPDVIMVISKSNLDMYKSISVETILSPAFRLCTNKNQYKGGRETVLLALSYFFEDAKRQLYLFKNIARFLKTNNIHVYIKNHPTKSNYTLEDYRIGEVDFEYSFVDGKYEDALNLADVIVLSNSTASYESVLSGKRVILVGDNRMCYSFMPTEWEDRFYSIVFESKDLKEKIREFLSKEVKLAYRLNIDEGIIRVSKESVGAFLEGKSCCFL